MLSVETHMAKKFFNIHVNDGSHSITLKQPINSYLVKGVEESQCIVKINK